MFMFMESWVRGDLQGIYPVCFLWIYDFFRWIVCWIMCLDNNYWCLNAKSSVGSRSDISISTNPKIRHPKTPTLHLKNFTSLHLNANECKRRDSFHKTCDTKKKNKKVKRDSAMKKGKEGSCSVLNTFKYTQNSYNMIYWAYGHK